MDKVLMDALNSVEWALMLKISIVAIIVMVAKRYYDNISSYLMFRSNVRVIVNGKEGIITQATWKFIYVSLKESDNELIIPITKWTNQKWEIFKNGNR